VVCNQAQVHAGGRGKVEVKLAKRQQVEEVAGQIIGMQIGTLKLLLQKKRYKT
jgi:succinyl-CoA synthetase beta subunit